MIMGQREQQERERKRAASTCQSLKKFLPQKKKASDFSTTILRVTVNNDNEPSECQWCKTVESVYMPFSLLISFNTATMKVAVL